MQPGGQHGHGRTTDRTSLNIFWHIQVSRLHSIEKTHPYLTEAMLGCKKQTKSQTETGFISQNRASRSRSAE